MGEALKLRLLSSNLLDARPFAIAPDPCRHVLGQAFFAQAAFSAQRTFPNNQHAPAQATALGKVGGIADHVAVNLGAPEFAVALRAARSTAVVAVPEAAVHKNQRVPTPQYNVGVAGNAFAVKAEAVAHGMQKPSGQDFRLRVFSADCGHEP